MDFELIKAQNTLEFESALLSMRVGDRISIEKLGINILRVPTGWVLSECVRSEFATDDCPFAITSVFIPFPDQT